MKKFVQNVLVFVTAVSAFFLLVANLACWVNPKWVVFPQFLGIIYFYILLLNFILFIFWVAKKQWIALLPLIIILSGFYHIDNSVGARWFGKEQINSNPTLKVMTFNVRLFDLYNWTHNKNTRNKLINYLVEEDPDIICFQEYYHDLTNDFETTTLLEKKLSARYYKIAPGYIQKNLFWYGVAIYSKYPIVNSGSIDFKNSKNNAQWVDIRFHNKTIRIFNLHLESNRLGADDYAFLRQINEDPTLLEAQKVKTIFQRFTLAYKRRARQADLIAEKVSNSPYPTIICGDINDTPVSFVYRKVKSGFSDAFSKTGFGFGTTFGSALLSARIDYIFYDNHFNSLVTRTGPASLSDHRPVWSILEILP